MLIKMSKPIFNFKNDWIYASILGILGLIAIFDNIFVSLSISILTIFFSITSIKSGNKKGYIGIYLSILIFILIVLRIFIFSKLFKIAV